MKWFAKEWLSVQKRFTDFFNVEPRLNCLQSWNQVHLFSVPNFVTILTFINGMIHNPGPLFHNIRFHFNGSHDLLYQTETANFNRSVFD